MVARVLSAAFSISVLGACAQLIGADFEGNPADAAPPEGGSDDAADAPEAGPLFCESLSPVAQLCDDFDGPGALTAKWDNGARHPDPGEQGGGALAFDTLLYRSGLRSMVATTGQLLGTKDAATAFLLKTIPLSKNTQVTFDVNVTTEQYGTGGFAILATVVFDMGAVVFVHDENGAQFGVVPDLGTMSSSVKRPAGTWQNVNIFVGNEPLEGGPNGIVQLEIDGNTAAQMALPSVYQTTKSMLVQVGPNVSGPALALRANFDNVAIFYGH